MRSFRSSGIFSSMTCRTFFSTKKHCTVMMRSNSWLNMNPILKLARTSCNSLSLNLVERRQNVFQKAVRRQTSDPNLVGCSVPSIAFWGAKRRRPRTVCFKRKTPLEKESRMIRIIVIYNHDEHDRFIGNIFFGRKYRHSQSCSCEFYVPKSSYVYDDR